MGSRGEKKKEWEGQNTKTSRGRKAFNGKKIWVGGALRQGNSNRCKLAAGTKGSRSSHPAQGPKKKTVSWCEGDQPDSEVGETEQEVFDQKGECRKGSHDGTAWLGRNIKMTPGREKDKKAPREPPHREAYASTWGSRSL